ncbi:hypothetical protein AC579_503 [Pseudocercospora musae]|uniref:Xylanolytic transcriptional activator regulatory domain-containing protein n=1 Tax=Pseudocercospora musae TaxID=113226 RepID=A0A139I5X3_9PEZI|nr:hypothetical protein AC579_503 [Pseudocercospora musae]
MASEDSSNEGVRLKLGVLAPRAAVGLVRSDATESRLARTVGRPVLRPKEERSRVTISKQYENKIDTIESRLASIETLLRQANQNTSSASAFGTPTSKSFPTPPDALDNPNDAHDIDDDEPVVEDLAFTGHGRDTHVAKDMLEQTITSSNELMSDPQLNASLSSLRSVLSKIRPEGIADSGVSPGAALRNVTSELPPWSEINDLVARAKEYPPIAWELYLQALPMDVFIKFCENMYQTDGVGGTMAERIIVYAGLYALATEFAAMDSGAKADRYHTLSRIFQQLAMSTISNFPLLAAAKRDNINALLIGSFIAIDMSKPLLAWSLNGAALRMCQTLGYQRKMTKLPQEEQDRNGMLFWNCYMMDRNTSLRLGRAPQMPDYDITVPLPRLCPTFSDALVHMQNFWIEGARIQGVISEKLYSPRALTGSPEHRASIAKTLVADLERAFDLRVKAQDVILPPEDKKQCPSLEPILIGDTIAHWSMMTLVLQAVATSPEAKAEALTAARTTLRLSRNLTQTHKGNVYAWAMYCNWVALHSPVMTAFTTLFTNAIANFQSPKEDMELLEAFVRSLEPVRTMFEGIDKFYQLCSVFYEVAASCVRLKQRQAEAVKIQQQQQPSMHIPQAVTSTGETMTLNDFDQYLSAIGLPLATPPMTTLPDNTFGNNANVLQDWYNANTSLYGLLDQDFTTFNDMNFDAQPGS